MASRGIANIVTEACSCPQLGLMLSTAQGVLEIPQIPLAAETLPAAVAEWSKALDLGSSPRGRGFEPLRQHRQPFIFSFSFLFHDE